MCWLVFTTSAGAASLEWNPNTETNLAGYRVYYGESSRSYGSVVDVGNTTSFGLDSLPPRRTHYFAVTAYDTDGLESDFSDEVTYMVPGVNRSPFSSDDSYAGVKNAALQISSSAGVLANDSDPDGDSLTAILVAGTTHGTLTLAGNGGFSYVPASGFVGQDSFTYFVSDGTTNSPVATVVISLVNRAPIANNDQYVIQKNQSLLTDDLDGVLANDSDPDGDSIAPTFVVLPANGQVSFTTMGGFLYTPATDFVGTDSFTYRVTDGSANSVAATVTVVVAPPPNRAPVVANDQFSGSRNKVLTVAAPGVLANDSDPDGTTLTVSVVSSPANGQLTLSSGGGFTYRPATNFVGSDSFTYRASDGATSKVATVAITVTNRVPAALADQYVAEKNKLLTIAPTAGLLANDSDPDGDVLVPTVVSQPGNGQVTVGSSGAFNYRAATDFVGTDTFTYRVSDGVANSAVATVTIAVTNNVPANRVPVATGEEYATEKNKALIVNAASGVLVNDYDLDGTALSAIVVTVPLHGQLTFDATGAFIFLPATNYVGSDSFTYRAYDGATSSAVATVLINITNSVANTNNPPVNRAPVAIGEGYATAKNTLLNVSAAVGVLANDVDPDNNAIVPALVSLPARGALTMYNNGAFLYMPAADFTGSDSFSYRASDGALLSAVTTVVIAVTNMAAPVNHAPTANAESYSTLKGKKLQVTAASGVLVNDFDADGNQISPSLTSPPANGQLTINNDGSFAYTPSPGFVGEDNFQYRAWDGAAFSAVVTVVIAVVESDTITCEDCLAELNRFVVARAPALIPVAAPPVEEGEPVTLPVAVTVFNRIIQKLGRSAEPDDVAQLLSVADCLLTVVTNTVDAQTEVVGRMYPSQWSVAANKVLLQLNRPKDASNPQEMARLLTSLSKTLARLETYVARSQIFPASLNGRTMDFKLVGASASQFVVTFTNGTFALQNDSGAIATGVFSFTQTAWDQGTLTLASFSAPPMTLQLQFRPGRGRVRGPVAKGTFILVP